MTKINENVIITAETDSTNNYAIRLIAGGQAVDQTVVLAYYQHAGKGQQGNKWESAPGMNLLLSIIVYPDFLSPGKQFCLSKVISLALADWLRRETGRISIKWPNDIYAGNKKIAGILIETAIQGNFLQWAVIGAGLNLNQVVFSPELPNPAGLKQLTGKEYDIDAAGLQIRNCFTKWYDRLRHGQQDEIDRAYLQSLFRFNEWTMFSKAGSLFEARIAGVGDFGQLVLEDRSGRLTENYFREIKFVT